MSFVKKLKDILFEEEEDLTVSNKEVEVEEEPKIVKIESIQPEKIEEDLSEKTSPKEDYKIDNSFQFPDFDEEEFVTNMSRQKNNANVLEYERKKTIEKKNDYGRYERAEPRYDRDHSERKKFKPSPVISPVYGILNQDYKSEDIIDRTEYASTINIEEVRKKAFEPAPEVIDEPVVTFFEDKEDNEIEKNDDYKSIDDLLEQASEEISLEESLGVPKENNLDTIEDELEKLEDETKDKEKGLDDTLDSDLFELIDSMYDDREEE